MKKILRIEFGILLIISTFFCSCSGAWYIGFLAKLEKFETEKLQYQSADLNIAEHPKADLLYTKASRSNWLRSVLVVKNGNLIAEWYAAGFDKDRAVNVKSVSKSIISALVGIAIEKGYIKSVDQPIFEILPEFFPPDSPVKRNITIRHLLTMSAGFEFVENVNNFVYLSDNWTKNILNLPLSTTPGSSFNYGTIQTHLLSAVLTKASGMDTLRFAQTHLLNHMHISINRWDKAPEGTFFGGSEMYLTPRDMAVFGQLYLQSGRFREQQLVPKEWVKQSLEPSFHEVWGGDSYGYSWWIKQITGCNAYYALGYGGQTIMIIPDKEMVIVFTADYPPLFVDHRKREHDLEKLIRFNILPLMSQSAEENL